MMSMTARNNTLVDKFRGCMIGGLLGDCTGAPFEIEISDAPGHYTLLGEFASSNAESKTVLNDFFVDLLCHSTDAGSGGILPYTDDTAMSFSVAKSLIEKGTYDPKDMAQKFVDEFYLQPNRGYAGVVHVFRALKSCGYKDVFKPAKDQFNGSGSYGNGAAMRVAPVALFGYKDENLIKQIAKDSSLITHAHQHGYNGAVLQALAVHQALMDDTSADFNPIHFVDTLLQKMEKIENAPEGEKPYCESLKQMKQVFEKDAVHMTAEEVAEMFGNHVTAHKSVPAAIFSFLRGFQPLDDFKCSNPFVRTLYFAIAIGGDTDTIGCMAGHIAGAYHGESIIPDCLMKRCEAVEEMRNVGDKLFQATQN